MKTQETKRNMKQNFIAKGAIVRLPNYKRRSITMLNKFAISIFIFFTVVGTVFAQGHKALWVWPENESTGENPVPPSLEVNVVTDPCQREYLLSRSADSGVDALYVSVFHYPPSVNDPTTTADDRRMYEDSDIAALIDGAHLRGMEVWLSTGDPAWPDQWAEHGWEDVPSEFKWHPYYRAQDVIGYNNDNPSAQFDGVILDVEHPTRNWVEQTGSDLTPWEDREAEEKEEWYQNLFGLYTSFIDTLVPHGLKLGVAISTYWETSVLFDGDDQPVYGHIIDLDWDRVVVSGYRDFAGTGDGDDGIIDLDKNEIAYADSEGKSDFILVGVETQEWYPEYVTFFEEGQAALNTETDAVAAYFDTNPSFEGFVIHYYGNSYLMGTPDWPATPVPIPAECIPDILPEGRIAFHSYTEYDDEDGGGYHSIDGVIHVVDLSTDIHYELAEVTIAENVQHAMNPKFSHDGSQLVFMGLPRTHTYSHDDDSWANYLDIFLYDFRTDQLTNLSERAGMAAYGSVEEDSDFSPDGQKVIFKRNRSDLWTIDLGTFELSQVTFDGADSEESGPRYSPDGQWVAYWVGSGSNADIYRQPIGGGPAEVVVNEPSIQEMYPAYLDSNHLLYSRWFSASQQDDELYVVDLSTLQSQPAPFNSPRVANDSDPFAVEGSLVGFSSDRSSERFRIGRVDWDLFFGNLDTGRVYWLEAASTEKHDLGGGFTSHVVTFEVEQLTSAEFMTQFKASIAGRDSNKFVRLTAPIVENHFQELLSALLDNDLTTAQSEIEALNALDVSYKLVQLTDVVGGPVLGFMESVLPGEPNYHGWGAVLVRPLATGYTIYQAPHVKYDVYTEDITLDAFVDDVNAHIAMFAGTHRYANGDADGDGEPDSDVAHDTENLFHALTVYLANQGLTDSAPYWFVQIHGAADRTSEPTITGSDGAVSGPPYPALTPNSPLVQIDDAVDIAGHVSMGVCGWYEGSGNDEDGDYLLAATTNVQGDFLESLGLRQTFMHFEIERSARDSYIAGSGPGHDGILSLLDAIRTTLDATPPDIMTDNDVDGVSNLVENGAPNGGDGNNDGVADGQQENVTSLPNTADGNYVTLSSSEGTLADVQVVENPSPGDAPSGVDFPIGFFEFTVQGITLGGSTAVTLFLPPGVTVSTYYKFGPTPSDSSDWYEFLFDGTTGAEILADRVILHLVDGGRGDDDLAANGEIAEPGAPATSLEIPLIEVPLDIKPQSCPNPLNVKAKGVLPAAILGTADFDVTKVDPASVKLEGVASIRWALEDVATPFEPFTGKEDADDCTDEGPDGFLDLTLKFDTQEVVQAIGEVEDGEVVVLSLTGILKEEFGGTPIQGEDVVVILKKGKPAPALLTFSLGQNFRNPFNPDTWIPYTLAKDVDVVIRIYSLSGQLVRTLDIGHQPAGRYVTKSKAAYWDGNLSYGEKVASGIYFYTLQAGEFLATRKMVILK